MGTACPGNWNQPHYVVQRRSGRVPKGSVGTVYMPIALLSAYKYILAGDADGRYS